VGVRKLNAASIFEILDWGSVADAAEVGRPGVGRICDQPRRHGVAGTDVA
jgi:hypothetical protein